MYKFISCVYIYIYTYICMCMCKYIYIYVNMFMYIYTHIQIIYIQASGQKSMCRRYAICALTQVQRTLCSYTCCRRRHICSLHLQCIVVFFLQAVDRQKPKQPKVGKQVLETCSLNNCWLFTILISGVSPHSYWYLVHLSPNQSD